MSHTILLYGATGFSGRLIAAEGQRRGMANDGDGPEPRMILAGRDADALAALAEKHGMDYRAFGLGEPAVVRRKLRDVDVLINAASPFAYTTERLFPAAILEHCHYVDINGAIDVYLDIEERSKTLDFKASAIVRSAGHTAAASDLMMTAALDELKGPKLDWATRLGAVHIALSCPMDISRGTAETVWHAVGEAVTVVRAGQPWLEPVGKLERTFDFRPHDRAAERPKRDLRIASAANLVDTLSALATISGNGYSVKSIESYVEAGIVERIAYQLGAFLSPVTSLPGMELLARQQIKLLPPGPSDVQLRHEGAIVLLDIEDPVRTPVVDWLWETPNEYRFTAQIVAEIAKRVVTGFTGFQTPGAILRPRKADLTQAEKAGPAPSPLRDALRGCTLHDQLSGRRPRR